MTQAATKGRQDPLDPTRAAKAAAGLLAALSADLEGDQQLIADTVEGETDLFEVIDGVLARIREAEIGVVGIKAIEKDLAERRKRFEDGQKRDRALLEQAMTIAGLTTIARPTATLSLSQRPPALVVVEESEIPADYWRTGDPVLDRKALTEALRERAEHLAAPPDDPALLEAFHAAYPPIPGVTLSNGAPSLTIRTK